MSASRAVDGSMSAAARPPEGGGSAMAATRISFDRVSVEFPTVRGPLRVVDDVSFSVSKGKTLCSPAS